MAQPVAQASFNSGEWSPHLYARVDLQKYHSGAALLRNFFIDYRGGASSRVGTRYVLQAYKSATPVRVIPFQAANNLGFALEFGDNYIRFHRNGVPVLEAGIVVASATNANPCVLGITQSWSVGDWIFVSGVGGMTQLNGKYYIVHARTPTTVTLYDLFGNPVDSTTFGTYTAGGTAARVYTIGSPYAGTDLSLLKFVQNVDVMIFTHPSFVPYALTFLTPTSWTMAAITFGTSILPPPLVTVGTDMAAGIFNYSYCVTAVDINGQESISSTVANLNTKADIRTTGLTISIVWDAVVGAQSYNIYKSQINTNAPVPVGVPLGFIGNSPSTIFIDSNIAPDFSTTPPIARQPFIVGGSVTGVTMTAFGSYTGATPTVSFTPPAAGITATGSPVLTPQVISATGPVGTGYAVGNTVTFANGLVITVASINGSGGILTANITSAPTVTTIPAQPQSPIGTSGAGTGVQMTFAYGITSITITNPGQGYTFLPVVSFSAGAAAASATIGPNGNGSPSVATFFQQRLVFAGGNFAPQSLQMSQPGDYFNFNISNPVQADDAIGASIVSAQLNNIKALVPQPSGLIVITDGVSFLINGGSLGAAVAPGAIVANPQSYVGSSDLPPIVSNFDILTVPAKGSSVRDSTYNFYANVFTGSDVSVLASHLFFGFKLIEWAWVEEPYKTVWAVRNDGKLLCLTFLKEQDFTAWSHHDTAGNFKSVATIVEAATVGYQNFLYCVVERTVQGLDLQYIEYFPERLMPNGVVDANTVDCSYQYSGSPATSFTGATALAGLTCTGLADGKIIPSFTMPTNGNFTLATAAAKVTVGLPFLPQLQTLPLDVESAGGTVQGKQKKINAVTARVVETLGLQAGTSFANCKDVKDLVIGNVGSMTNQAVTGLVTGDVRPFLDPLWAEQGQYCFQQPYPYPATILGVFPQVSIGDTPK